MSLFLPKPKDPSGLEIPPETPEKVSEVHFGGSKFLLRSYLEPLRMCRTARHVLKDSHLACKLS